MKKLPLNMTTHTPCVLSYLVRKNNEKMLMHRGEFSYLMRRVPLVKPDIMLIFSISENSRKTRFVYLLIYINRLWTTSLSPPKAVSVSRFR